MSDYHFGELYGRGASHEYDQQQEAQRQAELARQKAEYLQKQAREERERLDREERERQERQAAGLPDPRTNRTGLLGAFINIFTGDDRWGMSSSEVKTQLMEHATDRYNEYHDAVRSSAGDPRRLREINSQFTQWQAEIECRRAYGKERKALEEEARGWQHYRPILAEEQEAQTHCPYCKELYKDCGCITIDRHWSDTR